MACILEKKAFPELIDEVSQALAEGGARIRPLDLPDGQRIWLKRTETLSLRLRLLKGDSRKGLDRDRTGLQILGDAGLPVAPILHQGPDYIVTPDMGRTLDAMIRDPLTDRAELERAFAAAGRALAQLHRSGFCHGRPALRDICWDGSTIRLIDLECFSARMTGAWAYSRDLLILLHNILTVDRQAGDLAVILTRAYRAEGPARTVSYLRCRAMVLAWLIPATAPLRRLRPTSRELNAVPAALQLIWQLA